MNSSWAVIAAGMLSIQPVTAETLTDTNNPETAAPIIVTATRTAESIDETLASVSVITRKDIEASQAHELADLLKLQVGIDISKNGGPGSTTNIFTRGSNSNQTLILIDGMRVASSTTGTFALERLALAEIDHIEIVRGPRSSQYGSDAIGGIIHIFTRRNKTQHARIGYGSFSTHEASAGIHLGENYKLDLNASYEHSKGFSATNPGNFSYNPDDDGYRKNNASIGIDIPITPDTRITARGLFTDNWTEYDQGTTNTDGGDAIVSLDQNLGSSWSHKLSVGYNQEDANTSSSNPTLITTQRTLLDWQHDLVFNDAVQVLFGVTRYEDKARNYDIDDTTVVFDNRIDNNAVFGSLSLNSGTQQLLISLRVDDHSNFGQHNSGTLSWGYDAEPGTRFIATLSNAFRAPTLNELYHPGFDFGGGTFYYKGNPNLQPEIADGGEIGVRIKMQKQRLELTYFKSWIKNLIAYQGGATFDAVNINRARSEGFEISHQWNSEKWSTQSNLTLQRAYDADTNTDLLRRPRQKLSMVLTRHHSSDSTTRIEMLSSSSRSDFGSVTLPGYTLFNLGTKFRISKHVWLDGRIDNVTDKQYELAADYNTPDRSFYIGLSYAL